jgi:hypothetical protein
MVAPLVAVIVTVGPGKYSPVPGLIAGGDTAHAFCCAVIKLRTSRNRTTNPLHLSNHGLSRIPGEHFIPN